MLNRMLRQLNYLKPQNFRHSPLSLFSTAAAATTNNNVTPKKEIVTYLTLNNISDNAGAVKVKRRVGRGIGSSKGKTCGKGHKGQRARGGGKGPRFEGGQTPLHKRIPKRGFTNKQNKQEMLPINVGTLQDYIDMNRLKLPEGENDPPLNMKDLVDAGMAKNSRIKHGIKLLSKGAERVTSPIRIEISRASKKAIDAIEGAGGEITTVHYNRLALRALLKPHKFEILPRRALPPPKLMEYYNDYEKRGYLSPEIQKRDLLKRLASNKNSNQEEKAVDE